MGVLTQGRKSDNHDASRSFPRPLVTHPDVIDLNDSRGLRGRQESVSQRRNHAFDHSQSS